MDIVRRSMDLSQYVFNVTYSKRFLEGQHTISLIRLDNCKTFITVFTKEIIQRMSKHRVISVTRIKDHQGHKNLLQLTGDLYISCRTYISDEIFNKINRQQNFWFGRNAANRLMLFEDPEALYKCDCPEEPRTPAIYSPHEEPAAPLFQFDNMEIPNIQIRYSEHELPVTKYECDSPEESRVPTRYSEPDEDVPEEVHLEGAMTSLNLGENSS